MQHLNTALPGRDKAGGDPHSYTTLDGTVRIHVDIPEESYFIDARTDHDPKSLAETITQAEWWGLEVMDEEESPAEIVEDESGTWVRRWLAAVTGTFTLAVAYGIIHWLTSPAHDAAQLAYAVTH